MSSKISSQGSPGSESGNLSKGSVGVIRQEYYAQNTLFQAQPGQVERFLENQARLLAEALLQQTPQIRFYLPDGLFEPEKNAIVSTPTDSREQMAGGLLSQITRADGRSLLRHRLAEMEGSSNRGVAISGALIRHATAVYMVYNMLPSGRTVNYRPLEGEEIPSLPVGSEFEPRYQLVMRAAYVPVDGPEAMPRQSGNRSTASCGNGARINELCLK